MRVFSHASFSTKWPTSLYIFPILLNWTLNMTLICFKLSLISGVGFNVFLTCFSFSIVYSCSPSPLVSFVTWIERPRRQGLSGHFHSTLCNTIQDNFHKKSAKSGGKYFVFSSVDAFAKTELQWKLLRNER